MAKKPSRKERIPRIHVEINQDVSLHFGDGLSRIEFRDSKNNIIEDLKASIGECYKREGKQHKVLRLGHNKSGGLFDFKSKQLLYDRYLAIDTSYKEFGNNLLCTTCCLMTNQQTSSDGKIKKGEQLKFILPSRLVFLAKQNSKPERYGWTWFINKIIGSELFHPDRNYGVIVDSDLNEIPNINAKLIPIIDDFFIPNNFSLIYASADVGNESVLNKLIRASDRLASRSLELALAYFIDKKRDELTDEFIDIGTVNEEIDLKQYLKL